MTSEQFGMSSLAEDRHGFRCYVQVANGSSAAAYLADLRNNRVNRPAGARPLPNPPKHDSTGVSGSARASVDAPTNSEIVPSPQSHHQRSQLDVNSQSPSIIRHAVSPSMSSRYPTLSGGRDYYPDKPVQPLKPSEVVPSATYIERGQRWMEKEEAHSLRRAMEDMDLRDRLRKQKVSDDELSEEERIYQAALNEAAELVWQHQNPGKVPPPGAPYRYRPHLRKNSYAHARTASTGLYGKDVAPTGLARNSHHTRSMSGSSTEGDSPRLATSRTSFSSSRQGQGSETPRQTFGSGHETNKPYGDVASGTPSACVPGARARGRQRRNISGEVGKPFSPDQIWEEPDAETSSQAQHPIRDEETPLRPKPSDPLNRAPVLPSGSTSNTASRSSVQKLISKYEIHRNPPSQSRNPEYTINAHLPTATSRDDVPRKHGMEIRSEDIRQATSKKLKDRSPKLPTPSAVSDSPGRPIVSFDKNWKPPEEATDERSEESRSGRRIGPATVLVPGRLDQQQTQRQAQQAIPAISVASDSAASSKPALQSPSRQRTAHPPHPPSLQVDAPTPSSIPTIAVSDSSSSSPTPPSIVIEPDGGARDGPSSPVIVTPDDNNINNSCNGSSRPLPTPQPGAPRVRHQPRPRDPWPLDNHSFSTRSAARCHECNGPIQGRFISLAGSTERFHPECFTCYACGTSLEALEISPEPEEHRAARLDRIRRRRAGEILPEEPGKTMAEDGDERLRFYCHLDWHELFAPRCKHCKTPIMGEHVVALGAHWHIGHFFCAECGEPFGKGQTHIEKDGYAWCVSCQTKRTERRAPKCRKCRKAVIGQYIKALGGEWHDECFRCGSCGGGFDDGQIFPLEGRAPPGETFVLCTRCMEMELKA